jgi:hypothetical protein
MYSTMRDSYRIFFPLDIVAAELVDVLHNRIDFVPEHQVRLFAGSYTVVRTATSTVRWLGI